MRFITLTDRRSGTSDNLWLFAPIFNGSVVIQSNFSDYHVSFTEVFPQTAKWFWDSMIHLRSRYCAQKRSIGEAPYCK